MAEHVAATVPDRARRLIRTVLTVTLAVCIVLLALVPVVVQALEPVAGEIPGDWYAWLVSAAGTIVVVATAVQRILTSDVVEGLLQRYLPAIAAAPSGVIDATVGEVPVITDLAALDEARELVRSAREDGPYPAGPTATLLGEVGLIERLIAST